MRILDTAREKRKTASTAFVWNRDCIVNILWCIMPCGNDEYTIENIERVRCCCWVSVLVVCIYINIYYVQTIRSLLEFQKHTKTVYMCVSDWWFQPRLLFSVVPGEKADDCYDCVKQKEKHKHRITRCDCSRGSIIYSCCYVLLENLLRMVCLVLASRCLLLEALWHLLGFMRKEHNFFTVASWE